MGLNVGHWEYISREFRKIGEKWNKILTAAVNPSLPVASSSNILGVTLRLSRIDGGWHPRSFFGETRKTAVLRYMSLSWLAWETVDLINALLT
jgi:hypothetical protein